MKVMSGEQFCRTFPKFTTFVCILNFGTANVFTPVSIVGCSDKLCLSMLGIAQTLAQCIKLQQPITEEQHQKT